MHDSSPPATAPRRKGELGMNEPRPSHHGKPVCFEQSCRILVPKMSTSESVEPVNRLGCRARGLRLQMELSISPDDLK